MKRLIVIIVAKFVYLDSFTNRKEELMIKQANLCAFWTQIEGTRQMVIKPMLRDTIHGTPLLTGTPFTRGHLLWGVPLWEHRGLLSSRKLSKSLFIRKSIGGRFHLGGYSIQGTSHQGAPNLTGGDGPCTYARTLRSGIILWDWKNFPTYVLDEVASLEEFLFLTFNIRLNIRLC